MSHWLFGGRRHATSELDRPPNNFDVAGIPTGKWSTGLFACHENIPSCVMAFCCTPLLWSQIVIRSQIPALIDFKNYMSCTRRTSGYGLYIDLYLWCILFGIGGIIGFAFLRNVKYAGILLLFIGLAFLFIFYYIIGHVRTAFQMKYSLPGVFPKGAEAWDCVLDVILGALCHPCVIAQMARHVYQFDRWDPEIGFFLGDPSTLPPLENDFRRPQEADSAGLDWINDTNSVPNRGAPHQPARAPAPTFSTPARMVAHGDGGDIAGGPVPVAVAVPVSANKMQR